MVWVLHIDVAGSGQRAIRKEACNDDVAGTCLRALRKRAARCIYIVVAWVITCHGYAPLDKGALILSGSLLK